MIQCKYENIYNELIKHGTVNDLPLPATQKENYSFRYLYTFTSDNRLHYGCIT